MARTGTGRTGRRPEGPAGDRRETEAARDRAGRSGPQAPRRRRAHSPPPYTPPLMAAVGRGLAKDYRGEDTSGRDPTSRERWPRKPATSNAAPSGNKAAATRPLHSHSCWFLVSANDKGPGLASSQSRCSSAASLRGFAFLANERQLWGRGEVEATEEGKEQGCRQEGAELCGRGKVGGAPGAGARMGGVSTSGWKSGWGCFSGGFLARGVSGRAMGGASWRERAGLRGGANKVQGVAESGWAPNRARPGEWLAPEANGNSGGERRVSARSLDMS